MSVTVLGEGVLGVPSIERRTERYGTVDLFAPDGDLVAFGERPPVRGRLVAVVLEVYNEWWFTARHGQPALRVRPEPGQAVILGTGTLFTDAYDEQPGTLVGVQPDDGRDEQWLDLTELYRAKDQLVRLEFHPGPADDHDHDGDRDAVAR